MLVYVKNLLVLKIFENFLNFYLINRVLFFYQVVVVKSFNIVKRVYENGYFFLSVFVYVIDFVCFLLIEKV